VETLWSLFENQIVFRPRWIERYFPAIAERQRPVYSDIESMTADQTQATRHLLAEQVLHFEARARKERARSANLFSVDKEDAAGEGDFPIRVRLYREALDNLCDIFGLSNPLPGRP